ncbi:GMC family oxidoreductase N-terminal domain-containing protein [Paraburkholderia sediminicola]|nr:GMC family oxidoreductase N-terminal domain-containing protein [Paraburkholderia sediminicola]
MEWDHIVIGAGSAGAIVAARLSEDPEKRVLLVEAGGSADQLRFRIPALAAMKALGDPECDWLFKTEPDKSRLGRVDLWFRGKVLGGSSNLNGTIYVRGNRGDYDNWAHMGNTGWDYDSLLPFFLRQEYGVGGVGSLYGDRGPIHISRPRGVPKVAIAFVDAMTELGVPRNDAYNGETQTGAAVAHLNQFRGLRESTAHSYLKRAAQRPNLSILTHALARKILFDGKRAVGIEFHHDGEVKTAYANKDIVVSSSAFNTPKLLMLSGIGDREELEAHRIEVVHANAAVGKNLQEHPAVPIKAYVKGRTTNQDMNTLGQLKLGLQWALTRGGPATFIFPTIAFAKSSPEIVHPDLQFHFGAMANEITPSGVKWLDRAAVTMLINVNRSSSSGTVGIRSADPQDAPKIQPNMLADRREVELLMDGVRMGRKVWQTKAFAPFFEEEYQPGHLVESDEELEEFVRREASPSYHACGTAKMGVGHDAVVDPRLRVVGVENLRVVDCSIIPQVPSGNINAISMAIGEKGAAMIKEDYR